MNEQLTGPDVRARYERALDTAVTRLRADRLVLAVILSGSLAHDEVWAKSDIDLLIVTDDTTHKCGSVTLWEEGVNLHAWLQPRRAFTAMVQGLSQDSFVASLLSLSRPVYVRDQALADLLADVGQLGGRGRELAMLRAVCQIFPTLTKAEKWLLVKQDPQYAALYLLMLVPGLAKLETIYHGELPGREVVQQARQHNPELLASTYDQLLGGSLDLAKVHSVLNCVRDHLVKRRAALALLLEYMAAAEGPLPVTQIAHHFERQHDVEGIDAALEWCAEQGLLLALSMPRPLLPKSRTSVEEAAYAWRGV